MKRWLLVALLGAGWALRLWAIARQDLWGDEAFSVWLSRRPLAQVVAGGADTHPPLYPLLLFLWMRGAGHSVFAVRALSALTGFLLLPLGWRLTVELEGKEGRWAALALFALSPGLIYYAQETRMYSLAALAAALSFLATVRLLRGEDRRRDWLLFALMRVSPTPFCILDEVDAMLDEANVGRFRAYLQELAQMTQFIVITHNRGTVEAAETIYGVSMGEDGVSQLLSLRLEELPPA